MLVIPFPPVAATFQIPLNRYINSFYIAHVVDPERNRLPCMLRASLHSKTCIAEVSTRVYVWSNFESIIFHEVRSYFKL